MSETILKVRDSFDEERTNELIATFHRDGFALVPGVLDEDEAQALLRAVDHVFENPLWAENGNLYASYVAVRLFETAQIFEELLTYEPIISLVEAILGADCHLIAQNVVRNAPGEAIDFFHVDDNLWFALPPEIPRHDARITMPIFGLTVQIPLTDIPSIEYGPSEYIPGSHYSGRHPNDPKDPVFEESLPVPVLCKTGDIYLHNGQTWHRGAPNTSGQTRYLLQLAYAQRFVAQRFFPFVNYHMPEPIIARADERRRRVLGFHPRGAYG